MHFYLPNVATAIKRETLGNAAAKSTPEPAVMMSAARSLSQFDATSRKESSLSKMPSCAAGAAIPASECWYSGRTLNVGVIERFTARPHGNREIQYQ
jgi:hypothetical protein